MISSSRVGEKVALTLQDAGFDRWTVPDIAKWINAACRELVRLKPTALTAGVSMRLAAGTKQSLAGATFVKTSDGSSVTVVPYQLLEAIRNMGSDGKTPGKAIVGIERRTLDVMLPGWHTAAAAAEIGYSMFDPKDPLTFYNYPPVPATETRYAEVLLSKEPVNALSDDADELGTDDIDPGLSDIYEESIVDGTLAFAFAQDGDSPSAATRAAWHTQRFQQALGVKFKNEVALAPKRQFSPPPAEGV